MLQHFLRYLLAIAKLAIAILPVSVADAHEYWIQVKDGVIGEGEIIVADLQVGEALSGKSYPFRDWAIEDLSVHYGSHTVSIQAEEGQIPAIQFKPEHQGLHILSNLTNHFRLTYKSVKSFDQYVKEEGATQLSALHRERGLPNSGFVETYARCAKALVQVGEQAGEKSPDKLLGLPLELVAHANPYNKDLAKLRVSLNWQGTPLANQQVTIFHKTDQAEEATKQIFRSDANGEIEFSLSGEGQYLVNSVHIFPVDEASVAWSSYWASLYFSL